MFVEKISFCFSVFGVRAEYALGIGAGVRLFQFGQGFGVRGFYSRNNCEHRRCDYYARRFSDCRVIKTRTALVEISRKFGFSDLRRRRNDFRRFDRNYCAEPRHLDLRRIYASYSSARNRFIAAFAVDAFASGGAMDCIEMVQALTLAFQSLRLVQLATLLFGFGAVLLERWNLRRQLRSERVA